MATGSGANTQNGVTIRESGGPAICPAFPLDESPGFLINRVHCELSAGLSRGLRGAGWSITPEQWGLLNRLWQEDGIHQSELAARTAKDRHNITRILQLLERDGFITRRPDRNDARRRLIYLTHKGRQAKEPLVALVERYLDDALAGLTPPVLENLKENLNTILANLRAGAAGIPVGGE